MIYSKNHPWVTEKPRNYLIMPRIYAHGELKAILGFDLITTNSIFTYNNLYNSHFEKDRRTWKEKAYDAEGNPHEVTIFAWQADKEVIGLAVLNSNIADNEEAQLKQETLRPIS